MPKDLAGILLEEKKINKKQHSDLISAQAVQKRPQLELIKEMGLAGGEDLVKARSKLLNIPYVDLRGMEIPERTLNIIPDSAVRRHGIAPFELKDSTLKVAMTDPEDFKALETIEFVARRAGFKSSIYIISEESLDSVVKQYRNIKEEVKKVLKEAEEVAPEKVAIFEERATEIEKIVQEAPITKAVSVILRHAIEGRTSDIHIEPLDKETRVRYRIDGVLRTTLVLPKTLHSAIISRIKVLANLKIDETRIPQDGRFALTLANKEIDFRVSTLPVTGGEKVVMRLLDKTKGAPTLEELGLEGKTLRAVQDNIKESHGILLVTGPTGSGKSTTLYSVLDILNAVEVNIVTLEDPVEYHMEGINQSQVRPEVGFTFASGLRSILRQDPNIIMVGEIRDRETAEMAVHAALTGHLMLSTLHTNSVAGAIPRLIDLGIEPFLLAASINITIAQRLVRKICDNCKEKFTPSETVKKEILAELAEIPKEHKEGIDESNLTLYTGKGCERCNKEGYKGRVAIFEAIDVNEVVRDLILKSPSIDDLENQRKAQKMLNMRQDGLLKVLKGVTTLEEVLRVVRE